MKKFITIVQLLVGIFVVFFAFTMFWHAFSNIIPSLKDIVSAGDFPSYMSITPFNEWIQLILSIFIFYVVTIYTKKLFDKLSVD